MNQTELMWIIECVVLCSDGVSKKQMVSYGCSKDLAEMGLQLYTFLINKKREIEISNGH